MRYPSWLLSVLIALATVFGSMPIAHALSTKDLSGNCKADYKKWLKRGGFGAFAFSKNGYCGYSWDFPVLQNARNKAIVQCKAGGKGKGCVIVAEKDTQSTFGKNWKVCGEARGAAAVAACTWLIDSGRNNKADQAWSYNSRGIAYKNSAQTDRAIQDYSSAIKTDKTYPWAYINRARLLADKGESENAIKDAKNSLKYYKSGGSDYREEAKRLIKDLEERAVLARAMSEDKLCTFALKADKTDFESRGSYVTHVAEAARRGLDFKDCRIVLGYPAAPNPYELQTDANVCLAALDAAGRQWTSDIDKLNAISEAARRKLTVASCRNAAPVASNAYQNANNKTVCSVALNKSRDWWDTAKVAESAVKEAVRRNLTTKDCAGLLSKQVADTRTVEFKGWPDGKLCILAVNSNKMAWDGARSYVRHVSEARRRGLSVGKCRLAMGYPEQFNRYELFNDKNLCAAALDWARVGWNNSSDGLLAQAEVKRRPGGRFDWCLAKLEVQSPTPQASAPAIEAAPAAEKRFALVIGNSRYLNIGSLRNSERDALLMSQTLENLGFEVTLVIDADKGEMSDAVTAFGRKSRSGSAASLFYYSGHGMQINGLNYLIPIDADIQDESEVPGQSLDVNNLLQIMDSSAAKIKIVVLDACRNNKIATASRSMSGGLAPVIAPSGTYIAYATQPGNVANDGLGRNSPYTAALAEMIVKPGLRLEDVFIETRKRVLEATSNKQQPWESSSLVEKFFFIPTK